MNPFDYSVFITVVLAIFLNYLSVFIGKFMANHFEDDLKLTTEYEALSKKYPYEGLYIENKTVQDVTEKNMEVLQKIKKAKEQKNVTVKLPIIVEGYIYMERN